MRTRTCTGSRSWARGGGERHSQGRPSPLSVVVAPKANRNGKRRLYRWISSRQQLDRRNSQGGRRLTIYWDPLAVDRRCRHGERFRVLDSVIVTGTRRYYVRSRSNPFSNRRRDARWKLHHQWLRAISPRSSKRTIYSQCVGAAGFIMRLSVALCGPILRLRRDVHSAGNVGREGHRIPWVSTK
jgi:hypothetical protein